MKKTLFTTMILAVGMAQTVQAAPFKQTDYDRSAEQFAVIHMAASLHELQNSTPTSDSYKATQMAIQAIHNVFNRSVQLAQKDIQQCYAKTQDKERCSYQDNVYASIVNLGQQNAKMQLGMSLGNDYTLHAQTTKWNAKNTKELSNIKKQSISAYEKVVANSGRDGGQVIVQKAQKFLESID